MADSPVPFVTNAFVCGVGSEKVSYTFPREERMATG
jgi:hypothetical protein